MAEIDHITIQTKWQKRWTDKNIFKATEDKSKPKYYCLEMFPYPSGSGLHMGHAFNYTIGDVYSRFKRMNGFNVLYPMGYDSFGLPAENAAIKANSHPRIFTETAINNFIRQQKALGLSYDWDRLLMTHSPEYYKWNQKIFLKFLEHDLAYRKKASVNWCPKCDTVLANEQVHNGRCWRHLDTEIQMKSLEQWFIKTTKYAEELLVDLEKIDWPKRIKVMQENWIGKSFGTEIAFEINGRPWNIFTTRPDTIYGVTFMVISAQHQNLMELVTSEQKHDVEELLKKIKSTSEKDTEDLEKEGAFTGAYAINPITGDKIPVYAGNFVLAEYGSGMVMAVPAHDQRDFEFAKKYDIPIKIVITPNDKFTESKNMIKAYTEDGYLINSGEFSKLNNEVAKDKVTEYLESKGVGKKTVQYKLRDWLVSRQRYWGTPIPVVYCDDCGIVPVKESDLPIKLPEDIKFGEGNPILSSKNFVNTTCPKCSKPARRETDTMDTFFDSSWYFLRYTDSKNSSDMFDKNKVDYWLPVDQYIGGAEHACMHLVYARFFTKALRDMGYLKFDEPFLKLFNQGMLHGPDGFVMSKSRGNVVLPETISEKYGIDTARFFLLSIASPDKDLEWSDTGIEGSYKFVRNVFSYFENVKIGESSKRIESKINRAIKEVTSDIEEFRYNFAIIKLRALFDALSDEESLDTLVKFLKLLHPICPHITEELYEKIGKKEFLTISAWPICDESKIDIKEEFIETIVESARLDIKTVLDLLKIQTPKKITLIVANEWKYEFMHSFKEKLGETRDFKEIMMHILLNENLKRNAQTIQKLIPMLLKDAKKIPVIVLDQITEMHALNSAKENLSKEFKAELVVVSADESKEAKAGNALPGKPAILIE